MIRFALVSGVAAALAVTASTAFAQSAHVHGEGRLNIAIDGDRVFMALESPGADIVGFEHAPHSDAEKAAVAAALSQLADPAGLLRLSGDADCRVIENSAGLDNGEQGHDEQHNHDQHGRNDEQHDPSEHHDHEGHDHEGHEEHGEHEGHDDHADADAHSAFVAEYVFECGEIEALDVIEFRYFERFENAQSLDIVLIDGSGQRRVEVDRGNPLLRLAP